MDPFIHLVTFFLFQPCAAASNTTSDATSRRGWVSQPDSGRGTTDLLYACLFTILISTWTAMHLPVDFSEFYLKPVCMCGGLVAPEYISMVAINVHMRARQLFERVKELGPQVRMAFFPKILDSHGCCC